MPERLTPGNEATLTTGNEVTLTPLNEETWETRRKATELLRELNRVDKPSSALASPRNVPEARTVEGLRAPRSTFLRGLMLTLCRNQQH